MRQCGVRRHVPAEQRDGRGEALAAGAGDGELGLEAVLASDREGPVGLAGRGDGADGRRRSADASVVTRDARLVGDPATPRGVDGDDRPAGAIRIEQHLLGREVLLHVGVVVEVVVAEVGEADDVEDDAVDAGAAHGLRGHLDGDRPHLGLAHAGEQGVQLGGLGRGEAARDRLVADAALGGRAEAGADAELAQHRVEQVDDARLAVGAGDREEQRAGRSVLR